MYSILGEDCSVEIDQMQATNPQWAVGGRTQFKQVGKVGTVEGGQRFRRREREGGVGGGAGGGVGHQIPSHREIRVTPPESQ